MTTDQMLILAVIGGAVLLFLSGRLRHDIVALSALLAAVLLGLVPMDAAFSAFGHPAVITVACVLVLSRGLFLTGAVDLIAAALLPKSAGVRTNLTALMTLGAFLSSFMNNVGALALLMPLAIQNARKLGVAAGRFLMPLSFATILGGMVTLIGTPPNLIVAGYRERVADQPFGMFDYAPVGLAVALVGIAFLVTLGWRMVPERKGADGGSFDTGAYLTEITVPDGSPAVGMILAEVENALIDAGAQIIGLERSGVYLDAPRPTRVLQPGDLLVVEADIAALPDVLGPLGLTLAEEKPDQRTGPRQPGNLILREVVVRPESTVSGATAADLRLRDRYGINLLAVSRGGRRQATRLRSWRIRAGDMLLLQGTAEALANFAADAAFVPLAERDLRVPRRQSALAALAIFGGAIALTASGLLPAEIAFALGLLASMLFRTVPPEEAWQAIDWSVIVLLAALIPVAEAMETTGAAALIADSLIGTVAQGSPVIALAVILIVTMTLSDVMNNAATAAVMCPIAIGAASTLGVSPDPMLMAVAVGASCAFLTPIGHQNNTLILGPGGFRFGDYWRMGLVLELCVVAVSIPVILLVWPF